MSHFHVRQIQNHFQKQFGNSIDMSDVGSSHGAEERAKHFSSRALAAFALQMLCGVNVKIASKHVTDAGQDQGIDALYFDTETQQLFIVQSKWHHDGKGTIKVGDALKVVEGVKKLLAGTSSDFGGRLWDVWESIQDEFLESASAKIVVCLVHTGVGELNKDVLNPIADYFDSVNDVSEIISLRIFAQKDVHDHIASSAQGKPINLEILMHDWGRVSSPFDAVYGRVLASDVAAWVTTNSRDRLLSQNIRKILVDSDINESIEATLRESPQIFWYFNNGITILCDSISQKPVGAGTRDSGLFVAADASVVNGAQTAGAISKLADPAKLIRNRSRAYAAMAGVSS